MGWMLRPESRELHLPSSPASCRRAGSCCGCPGDLASPHVRGRGGEEPAALRMPTSTLSMVLANQAWGALEEQDQEMATR